MEPDCLPTLRLTIQGTRTVVVARLSALKQFAHDIKQENVTLGTAHTSLNNLAGPLIHQFADKYDLWVGTIGASDVPYMPMFCVAAERTLNAADTVGVKLTALPKKDVDAMFKITEEVMNAHADKLLGIGNLHLVENNFQSLLGRPTSPLCLPDVAAEPGSAECAGVELAAGAR